MKFSLSPLLSAAIVAGLMATAPAVPASAQSIGKTAPDFVGRTQSGDEIRLSDLRGKVVVLDFWASWCGPCREEMPFLVSLARELKNEDFQIVGINVDEQTEDMNAFLAGLGTRPTFPIVLDPRGDIAANYRLPGMPTTVFVDRDGVTRLAHSGFKDKDKDLYRDTLKKMLAEAPTVPPQTN